MSDVKLSKVKDAPEGFDRIKPALIEFELDLKEIHNRPTSKLSAKANENLWEIMRITHERSRYIYNLHYKRKAISKDLYLWLLKHRFADKALIAKWKKRGYEKLCCVRCIQNLETVHGNACICRVPRAQLETNKQSDFTQCVHCGCRGCSSTD